MRGNQTANMVQLNAMLTQPPPLATLAIYDKLLGGQNKFFQPELVEPKQLSGTD